MNIYKNKNHFQYQKNSFELKNQKQQIQIRSQGSTIKSRDPFAERATNNRKRNLDQLNFDIGALEQFDDKGRI